MRSKSVFYAYALQFLWPAAILLAILLYSHGIGGPFLFDDFANLDALGAHGGVDDWKSLWLYLSQGDSGPTGRPLALLSFLIDDNTWPSHPDGFKYTNILIHALNGCLLFWLQYLLLGQRFFGFSDRQRFSMAFLGAFLWLAHPLFVSTVLYVVQRMAMLAATFVLAGLLSHVYFRSLIESRPTLAYWGMTLGVGFWGLLAILSKENGALLPVLILTLESTVYANSVSLKRLWKAAFLQLPTVCILGYLLYIPQKNGFFTDWSFRDFSPYERLITECRIIWEYLFHLYSFQGSESGLFHDGIRVSTSLTSPPTTILSVVAVVLLGLISIVRRKVWPLFSLAFVFYLAGHLVESTSVGLELYFEHRNYLPSFFLFVPVAWQLVRVTGWVRPAAVSVVCVLVALLLYNRVDLWSSKLSLATAWAAEAPESIRAQRSAAIALTQEDRPLEALRVLDEAFANNPGSHALLMHRILLKCSLGQDIGKDKKLLIYISREESFNPKLTNLMEAFVGSAKSRSCPSLNMGFANELISALMDNPRAKSADGFLHQLYYFSGVINSHENKADKASESFSSAIALRPKVGAFMQSIAVLASDGHCEAALEFAKQFKGTVIHGGSISGAAKEYYRRELVFLLDKISKDCITIVE